MGSESTVAVLRRRCTPRRRRTGLVKTSGQKWGVSTPPRPPPNGEDVPADPDAVADSADRGCLGVHDLDRHLLERQSVSLHEVEDLDVESEAVDRRDLEQGLGDIPAERFQAALCVAVATQQQSLRRQVDGPATQRPEGGRTLDSPRLGMMPISDHDVPARLDLLHQSNELSRRIGEIGVGERDGGARGRFHAGADGGSLALVLVEDDHDVGPGPTGLPGRAVGRPVVDDDDLDRSRGADLREVTPKGLDGRADSGFLTKGRNHH